MGLPYAPKTAKARPKRIPSNSPLVTSPEEAERVRRPAQAVNTGHPLPAWANTVVMIEHTQLIADEAGDTIEIRAALPPGIMCGLWAKIWWLRSWCCPPITKSGRSIWAL
ncbi:MAG: hypothetical protein M5U34_27365 [Chloroflexi bacterium]|nr:hypothetical protein [Chloroflexota bacterium]